MNNIEILEEFIDKVDIYFNDDIGDCAITSKIAGIIKNLIQENKELKENQIWSEATIEGLKKDFVPAAKLKEKIEVLKMKADYDWIYKYDYEDVIKILQELLEEGE